MRNKSSNSILDRRLQDIDKELGRVQADVKHLTRAIHDPRGRPLPKLQTRTKDWAKAAEPGASAETAAPVRRDPPAFTTGVPTIHAAPSGNSSLGRGRDSRMASFLSGKHQVSSRYSDEHRVQRNKALLMIAAVAIVLFVILRLKMT